jgi:hypothetical protein
MGKTRHTMEIVSSTYGGGIIKLCSSLGCTCLDGKGKRLKYSKRLGSTLKTAEMNKHHMDTAIMNLAKNNFGALSGEIISRNSSVLNISPVSLRHKINKFYGGYENMCKELNITWTPSTKGIDYRELDILKDMRKVYLSNSRKFSKDLYSKEGRFSLKLIEEYFGSFIKACKEINIITEEMREQYGRS